MKRLALLIAFVLMSVPAFAADYYYANAATVTNDGTSCANAWIWSNATNGIGTAGKWSPGNILHLCETITITDNTTFVTSQASGTSGAGVITIKWETGAILTAGYWPATGGIVLNHDFIVVDGGTNGIFRSTTNGTALANQADSRAIMIGNAGSPNDIEVKNLTISNMCVRVADDTNVTCSGSGVRQAAGVGNIIVHHNTIHDVENAIYLLKGVSASGDQIYSNTIYNRDAGVVVAPCANSITITGLSIYDNDIGSARLWDDPPDPGNRHHDGIHLFNCPGVNGVISNALVYNNTFDGDFGTYSTAAIFLEDTWSGIKVFNNIVIPSAGFVNDGMILLKGGASGFVLNNTIICPAGGTGIGVSNSTDSTIKNNIVRGCTTGLGLQTANAKTSLESNDNFYYQVTQMYDPTGLGIYSIPSDWTTWQTNIGIEADSSVTMDPELNGSYIPSTSSNVYQEGENLTSLSITALNTSLNSVARGAMGGWTIGANDADSGCTASKVLFISQPGNAVLGATLGTVSVGIYDSGSNLCTGETATVAVAKTGGTCTGMTLGGTLSGAASSGVFTTTNLNVTVATGACTLTATSSGLTDAISNSFTISSAGSFGGASRGRAHR